MTIKQRSFAQSFVPLALFRETIQLFVAYDERELIRCSYDMYFYDITGSLVPLNLMMVMPLIYSVRGLTLKVRLWRIKSIPALKEYNIYNGRRPII